MVMIKEKEVSLKHKLKEIIAELGCTTSLKLMDSIKKDVVNEFIERNMSEFRAILVFAENLDLNTLTNSDEDIRFLFIFTFALNKALKKQEEINISIDVEDYFTKIETDQWKNYKRLEKAKDIYPLVFKKTQQVGDRIWQTVLSAQQLNELDTDNLLIYNFKTQRNPKITAQGEQINIDKQKVREIKERLLSGEQFPDPIILNILNNGDSNVAYDEKNETLTIFEGSVINLVDGSHRKIATGLALEINPNLPFNWQITLTFLSEKSAHDYMTQKDKQKPMKREYIQQMDYSRPENLVIDVIVDDRLSELAKAMKDDDAYIKLNKALTKKSIIAQAIEENYREQIAISTNIRRIGRWVVEFTDYLMGSYAEEFIINPYNIKETSMINNKNMFYGYIAFSAKLMGNKNWEDILIKKMESIDFSKDNPLWKEIGIIQSNKDASKTQRGKLYNLFTEGVE